jgi:hypothetical protein
MGYASTNNNYLDRASSMWEGRLTRRRNGRELNHPVCGEMEIGPQVRIKSGSSSEVVWKETV